MTLLYQVVARDWPGFSERAEVEGGLPKFVVDEFEVLQRSAVDGVEVALGPVSGFGPAVLDDGELR